MKLRTTHTYVLLEVSAPAYDEIHAKLTEAGYQHAFSNTGEIDMHGIAVMKSTEPVAAVEDSSGWVIDNGRVGDELRFRCMDFGCFAWTSDVDAALRFARRQDAEKISEHDEDAWCITPYAHHIRPQRNKAEGNASMHVHISTTGIKAEVLERLKEPGSAGTLSDGPGIAPPNELETTVRKAIADHIQTHAGENGNVRVTASVSLTYPKLHAPGEHEHTPSPTDATSTSDDKSA